MTIALLTCMGGRVFFSSSGDAGGAKRMCPFGKEVHDVILSWTVCAMKAKKKGKAGRLLSCMLVFISLNLVSLVPETLSK